MSDLTNSTQRTRRATGEPSTRAEIAVLRDRPRAEVLVIGGGINGIATFRDLALQGVDVVLVERGDFVSGASAASSHMIHGGIRYLENGEFRLVKESVEERNGLLRIAPHYVKPLETTVPIFSTFSGILSAPMRFLTHRAGRADRARGCAHQGRPHALRLVLARRRTGAAAPLPRREAIAGRPAGAEPRGEVHRHLLRRDACTTPSGSRSTCCSTGSRRARTPARRTTSKRSDTTRTACRVRDTLTGDEFAIAADVVVNTSGPWTDLTNAGLGNETRFMGGTKGSHIVLDHPELLAATGGREIFFEHDDGRIVLIYPLKGRVLVGTTDLEHDIREPAVCTDAEVDYFFDLIAHVFPAITVDRSQIVFRFAGVRPLPRHDDTQPGFVSRDYRIERADAPGRTNSVVLSLVGGKWTTFRALAEHLSDEVLELLGRSRVVSTKGLAIGGGAGYPATDEARRVWLASHGEEVGRDRAFELLERYGTRAEAYLADIEGDEEMPLVHHAGYGRLEIAWLARTERVVHLADVVLRRTSIAFTGTVTAPLLDELAELVGAELGWDGERRRAEVQATRDLLAERHGVVLADVISRISA